MAICCRSSRDLSLVAKATPSKVGPGTYDLNLKSRGFSKLAPPFQSATLRKPFDDFRNVPGPGDYTLSDGFATSNTPAGLQVGVYQSRSDRFCDTYTNSPGPNVYSLPDNWLKKSFRNKVIDGSVVNYSERLNTSIPAIPVRQQCTGYQETLSGDICLAESGTNDCDKANPGPGAYNLESSTLYSRLKTMATFGKCKSERGVFSCNQNPGPGRYSSPKETIASKSSDFILKDDFRSASFRSGTLLAYQTVLKDSKHVPGPGAYDTELTELEQFGDSVSFGSTQKRRYQETSDSLFAPWQFKTPAPCAYQSSSEFALQDNFNPKDKPGFFQSSDRFEKNKSLPLGPGEYNVVDTIGKKEQYKHVLKAGFLSAEKRENLILSTCAPGPEKYALSVPWQNLKDLKHNRQSYMFASTQNRFLESKGPTQPDTSDMNDVEGKIKGDVRNLGPGTYNISGNTTWKQRSSPYCRLVPFSCSETRFIKNDNFTGRNESSPGPAEYQTSETGSSLKQYSKNVYFSTQQRFRPDKKTHPGPGHYYATNQTMNKKSFNVTF